MPFHSLSCSGGERSRSFGPVDRSQLTLSSAVWAQPRFTTGAPGPELSQLADATRVEHGRRSDEASAPAGYAQRDLHGRPAASEGRFECHQTGFEPASTRLSIKFARDRIAHRT